MKAQSRSAIGPALPLAGAIGAGVGGAVLAAKYGGNTYGFGKDASKKNEGSFLYDPNAGKNFGGNAGNPNSGSSQPNPWKVHSGNTGGTGGNLQPDHSISGTDTWTG